MAKLTAEQLKALPDSMFGLPKERKYPMPDEEHVRKAIQFFRYCEESKRPELAKNINRRAKELKMKLKIQPSSAFYKYADKEILKEGMMIVDEFHIGQLSPIVPIERPVLKHRMLSKNNSKPPIERLKNLWDSKKALDIKKEASLDILGDLLTEHAEISLDIFKQFNGISDLCYMLEAGLFDTILGDVSHQSIMNLKGRINDNDNHIYNDIIVTKSMPFGDIKYNISQIKDPAVLAKAISFINYSDLYTELKKFIKKMNKLPDDTPKCSEWKDAFKGSGAYYSLKNMILFHGVVLKSYGCTNKEESIEHLKRYTNDLHIGDFWRIHMKLKKVIAETGFDLRTSIARNK